MKRKPEPPAPDPHHPSLSAERPLFIDNRDGNTLDVAVRHHLAALRGQHALAFGFSAAATFFDVPGFRLLADDLEHAGKVRPLLGAEPAPEADLRPPAPGDPPEPEFTRRCVGLALARLDTGLRAARDRLPFDGDTARAVERLLEWLGSGKVEVRRHEDAFLPARGFLFHQPGGGIVFGSANFSEAGLRGMPALALGHYEDIVAGKVEAWFDELWVGALPYDLGALYEGLTDNYPPYLIYLRVLLELYGRELEQEEEELGDIPVTTFQKHGVWRALRILREFGGVLVADGVGLGKTFLAGEIVRQYLERRQRVLLVCPAALRDSTWRKFLDRFMLYVTMVSYEQLARDRQLGGDANHLLSRLEEFQLVVVDESHNFRNPDAPARAGVLRQVLAGQRRDLLLLSATPVNNSLWDLYHLVRYFLRGDADLAGRGVLSLRERFKEAMDEDPFNLNPDLLYPVIDATTVKRTRHFVKKYYENDLITMPDGRRLPIHFPKPKASSISYRLDAVLPDFLDRLEQALMPPGGEPALTLARYHSERYRKGEEAGGNPAVVGLLRSGLLKRFESSVHAFAQTTAKMVREHDLFLEGLGQGKVIRKDVLRELAASDDDDEVQELLDEAGSTEPAAAYDVKKLRQAVTSDRDLLHEMCEAASGVTAAADPKLAALLEELARIVREAEKEGVDDDDRRRKRKVLVFSFYEDTIDWIEEYLRNAIEKDKRLAAYKARIASVAGSESRNGVPRQEAIYGFAPESTESPDKLDRFDILLCTDVLAEGMNLQECRNIINYDLPWNPMRLVQRHGRIDRIGSPHDQVFLRTFFPDDELNRLLALEARVRRKLAQAAASVGVEVAPIELGAERDQSFAETREEIERLRQNDPTLYEVGGTAGAAQSGEEYRQELRQGLMRFGDQLRLLPWKAGSGLAKGKERGHFFCARAGERVYLRFVPFGEDRAPVVREMGTCLRLIECSEKTERMMPVDLRAGVYAAWCQAREDIHECWTHETDPANLQPRVSKLNRQIAAFLRESATGIDQKRLERCLEAVEAPVSRREENALRGVFECEYTGRGAKALAVMQEVERLGLEPFVPPRPLDPIRPEDIHLVCWLAVERSAART
jgi:hypothetical protein